MSEPRAEAVWAAGATAYEAGSRREARRQWRAALEACEAAGRDADAARTRLALCIERGVQGDRPGSAGLGLAVVRHVAAMHEGDARYAGTAEGACFVLRLPAAAETA